MNETKAEAPDARLERATARAKDEDKAPQTAEDPASVSADQQSGGDAETNEVGGPKGPEPTRYGDWERKGRCIDF